MVKVRRVVIFDVDVEAIRNDDPDAFIPEFDFDNPEAVQAFADDWVDSTTGASVDNYIMLDDIQTA